MIIVKLWGGLCNQMFQYAFGYALSKKKNDMLAFDTSFYDNQPQYVSTRELEIENNFNLPDFRVLERPKEVQLFQNRIVSNLVRRVNFFRCNLPNNIVFIKEREHVYTDNVPYFAGKTNYYDGYWQSSGYFCEYKDEILKIFTPKTELNQIIESYSEIYNRPNSIALHIRRGDLTGKINGYSEKKLLQFYENAMQHFAQIVKEPEFFIFSDDIAWCRNNLPHTYGKLNFGEDIAHKAIYDLFGIASCTHGIMSASTFSWWGNWLRTEKDSVVICPKGKYFNNCFLEEFWIKM